MKLVDRMSGQQYSSKGGADDGGVSTTRLASDASTRPVRKVVLDVAALRARGYLPEEEAARCIADHYRRIKRSLLDKVVPVVASARPPRVIMVTSALPGDGKTFTSINLALSMGRERDLSVLLVDCDVVKRHVSDIFGLQGDRGLVDALIDESIDPESLVVATDHKGLSIMPAGSPNDGASEYLSSNRMRHIVAALCAHSPRRIVLLDSPPLLITDEGRALTKIAGQIALVVRAGLTPRQAVLASIKLLEPDAVGGFILNDVDMRRSDSYYSGYGAYGKAGDAR